MLTIYIDVRSQDQKRLMFIELSLHLYMHFALQPVKDMMEKGSLARWGNQIGYVLYPFKIVKRDNPIQYVHRAKDAMDRKKASLESRFSYVFSKFLLKCFGIQVRTRSFTRDPNLYLYAQ